MLVKYCLLAIAASFCSCGLMWQREGGVFKWKWKTEGNFMTLSASPAPEGHHRLNSTFLSTCEILATLWLVCHCSIPTKISNVLLFGVEGQHESLGGNKRHVLLSVWKRPRTISWPKICIYIHVLSSQKPCVLAGIGKSAAGLSDVEGDGSWMYTDGIGSS